MLLRRGSIVWGAALLLLSACGDDPAVAGASPDLKGLTSGPGTGSSEVVEPSTDTDDTGQEEADYPACEGPEDCESEICVLTQEGSVCTEPCVTYCPKGFECKLLTTQDSDTKTICVPKDLTLCFPCHEDNDCAQVAGAVQDYEGAKCIPHGDNGSFCGAACAEQTDCPDGYECSLVQLEEGKSEQCVPKTGECGCSQLAEDLGVTTPCSITNALATCEGERRCLGGQLTACDAESAGEEKCDGIDNNCNGQIDEGIPAPFSAKQLGACKGTPMVCGGSQGWLEPDYTTVAGFESEETTCDNVDNDCDGQTDEDFLPGGGVTFKDADGNIAAKGEDCGIGPCAGGTVICDNSGEALTCSTLVGTGPELCDGVDNDCDQFTEDGLDDPGVGVVCDGDDGDLCKAGVSACLNGLVKCVEPDDPATLEVCDLLDNDCNPATPDGFADPGANIPCDGEDTDLCKEGFSFCVGGALFCTDPGDPDPELCDNVDNDCNPETPDGSGDPKLGKECDGEDPDLCKEGVWTCDGIELTCDDPNDLDPDICDLQDNDCNPSTPDGSGDGSLGQPCDGDDGDLCEEGIKICGPLGPKCTDPNVENLDICDGMDNDCSAGTPDGSQVVSPWSPTCAGAAAKQPQSLVFGQGLNLAGGFNRLDPVDYIQFSFVEPAVGTNFSRSISLSGNGYVMTVMETCPNEPPYATCDGDTPNAAGVTAWSTTYQYDAGVGCCKDNVARPSTVIVKVWREGVAEICEPWGLTVQNN